MKFYCVFCGASIRIPTARAGETIECPGCRERIVVPESITCAIELGEEQKALIERGHLESSPRREDNIRKAAWFLTGFSALLIVGAVAMTIGNLEYFETAIALFTLALALLAAAFVLGRRHERDFYERYTLKNFSERVQFSAEGFVSGNPRFDIPRVEGRFVVTPSWVLHFSGRKLLDKIGIGDIAELEMGSEEQFTLGSVIVRGLFGTSPGKKRFLVHVACLDRGYRINLVFDFINDVMGNIFYSKVNHFRYRSHLTRRMARVTSVP